MLVFVSKHSFSHLEIKSFKFVSVYKKPVLKAKRITVLVREGSSIFLVCYWTDNGHEKYFPEILLRSKTGTREYAKRKEIEVMVNERVFSVTLKELKLMMKYILTTF